MSNTFPTTFGTSTVSGNTSFHYYDEDANFQSDAQKFAAFAATKFGNPTLQVELYDNQLYTCYEDAVTEYTSLINTANMKYWLLNLLGQSTSSNLTHKFPLHSLDVEKRYIEPFAKEAGANVPQKLHSSSITLTNGIQLYDLRQWVTASHSSSVINIQDIMHYTPSSIARSLNAWYGADSAQLATQLEFGSDFSLTGDVTLFYIYPLTFTVQRAQQIELSDRIRRSAFSYELHDNILRIYPEPTNTQQGLKVWFTYYLGTSATSKDSATSDSMLDGITDLSNVPYQTASYSKLNSIAKQWIKAYALCNAKEILGYVRGKFNTIPIPDSEVTLNWQELLSDAKEQKQFLRDNLLKDLEQLDPNEAFRRKNETLKAIQESYLSAPLGIYIG